MQGRTSDLEGQTRGDPNTFLFSLVEFCVDSFTICFSRDADKRCVPVGLSSLSALLLLLSCLLLVCQRCTFRGENRGETITLLYSLLGSLCCTVGAILSRQLHIQVLMGAFAAVMDAVSFISCCFHVLLCWNSKAERKRRMMRGRRRQHLLAVCVLMVVAGGVLKSRVTHQPAFSRRRLLHANLHSIFNFCSDGLILMFFYVDNTEILGYILGLLSFVIACTSRFPALYRAYRGQILTWAYVLSGLLCSLAGALYAAAILFYDTQFGFLLRVMPWLLSAICCVTLDLLLLVIHWWKRGTRQQLTSFRLDTESLLGITDIPQDNAVVKRQRKQQVHSSTLSKTKHVQKTTEMGRYMDVSVNPAGKVSKESVVEQTCCMFSLPQLACLHCKEEVEDHPLDRMMRVIRVNGSCSWDTSCESSPVSSDLEWDFEEASAQWSEPIVKQQERDDSQPQ